MVLVRGLQLRTQTVRREVGRTGDILLQSELRVGRVRLPVAASPLRVAGHLQKASIVLAKGLRLRSEHLLHIICLCTGLSEVLLRLLHLSLGMALVAELLIRITLRGDPVR